MEFTPKVVETGLKVVENEAKVVENEAKVVEIEVKVVEKCPEVVEKFRYLLCSQQTRLAHHKKAPACEEVIPSRP